MTSVPKTAEFFQVGDRVKIHEAVLERDFYNAGITSPFTISWLLDGEETHIRSIKALDTRILCLLDSEGLGEVWVDDWMLERII